MKPSTASQSKTCLTLLPEDKTESAWEDELYVACINKKIKKTVKKTDQYLLWVIICTASCSARRKAKERTLPWLEYEDSIIFQRS